MRRLRSTIGATRPARVVAALTVVAGLTVGAAAAAAAPPKPVFGLRPAEAGLTSAPNGDFNYAVAPGGSLDDAVVIENLTHAPLTLRVYAADLIPLRGGGFGVSQFGTPMQTVGAWTEVPRIVTLQAAEHRSVPFHLAVPAGTPGGDYGGAIVAENSPQRGVALAIQTRVALEIHLHVPGAPARLGASLGPLQTRRSGGAILLSARLSNTGNESFSFRGRVTLDQGGSTLAVQLPMAPGDDLLFPGQHATLTARWTHAPRWATVTARGAVTAVPTAAPTLATPSTFTDQPIRLRFFPWLLIILAILALLLLLLVVRETWRRREQWRVRLRESRQRRRAVRRFKQGLAG